jgi:hypothetical protein
MADRSNVNPMSQKSTGTALVVWRQHRPNPAWKPKTKKMRTICEVLRELLADANAREDAVSVARIEEAYDMAKRMDRKLRKDDPEFGFITANGGYFDKDKNEVKP